MTDLYHPPSSPEAVAQGCTCSPVLNGMVAALSMATRPFM